MGESPFQQGNNHGFVHPEESPAPNHVQGLRADTPRDLLAAKYADGIYIPLD